MKNINITKRLQELWENHRSWLFTASGILLFIIAGLLVSILSSVSDQRYEQPAQLAQAQSAQLSANPVTVATDISNSNSQPDEQEWCLYITGSVRKPDVYYLPKNSRLHHLIEAAGGFDGFADREILNLAAPLEDGMHVHVPRKGESKNQNDTVVVIDTPVYAPGLPMPPQSPSFANMPPGPGITSARPKATQSASKGLININRASIEELQGLRGIGPALAARIVEYRQQHGAFTRIEDIVRVRGIGDAKFRSMKNQMTVH